MYKEVGGEFWDIPQRDSCITMFPKGMEWFVSGRAALYRVLLDIKEKFTNIHKAVLPSWCCESMIFPFLKADFEVEFYSVVWNGEKLVRNVKFIDERKVVLLIDYFGFIDEQISDINNIIIHDITHSCFTPSNYYGDYIIGSMRKWAGFLTGGFACCQKGEFSKIIKTSVNEEYINLRKRAMDEKKEYIEGIRDDKGYLDIFSAAQKKIYNCDLFSASERDIQQFEKLDIDYIVGRRRENALMIINELKDYVMFPKLKDVDVPLFVPIILPNDTRDYISKKLILNNIFCPIHWPISELHNISEREKMIYYHELSLICDQRYETDQLMKMVQIIKKCLVN